MEKKKNINNFGKQGWLLIVYVFFLFFISSFPVDVLNISVEGFANMKQWDGGALLVFSSIGAWLTIIISALIGRWVAAKGVKTPTVIALLIAGVCLILNGFANSVLVYGIAVVLGTSVTGAVNLVSTNTYTSNWFPQKKGIALGWSSMGMCFSGALGVPVFAAILGLTHSFALPFGVFGVLAIILALVAQFGVKTLPEEAGAFPDNEEQSKENTDAVRQEMKNYKSPWTTGKLLACKQVWLVSLTFGLLFIALMATMTQFVPRFMGAGFSQGEALMWLTIASALGIIGSYLWGYLDQKTTTKTATVVFAVYMMAMQFLNAAFFTNKTISTILIVLIGLLIGGIGNLFPSMVIQIFGRYDSAAANNVCVPILTAIRACTFILIAAVLGATHGNFRILCVILGFVSLAAVILSIFINNKTIGKAE
ncbi:MAG: MFS transporter [Treponema sp.]|jgi:sugar phosphate permease|nr:MFS transporter [Treponema sp.]